MLNCDLMSCDLVNEEFVFVITIHLFTKSQPIIGLVS